MAMVNLAAKQENTFYNGIKDFFSSENFHKLEELMKPIKEKAGSYLFWEGDQAKNFYFVRSGQLKLMKTTEDGKDLILSIAKKGELLGDYTGLGNGFHSYSAITLEDVEIGMVSMKDIHNLLCQFGSFSMEFMNWLGVTYQKNQSKFRDLLLFGKKGALASTLIRMGNTYGIMRADGIKIDVKLTNTEIGDFIGMTRESVNRFLNQWRDEGTISIEDGYIIIRKLSALREVCNCPKDTPCPVAICRI
ncbi:Crp/Fnr family transcriptional regulator [Anaerobacillus sp. MEB173]|uniref:Crp/Fnr family transcriptional regulator n=1 Tax=Anaerobacillus sp. MEB173 TaxID=3383345 RepID=UPI003F93F711